MRKSFLPVLLLISVVLGACGGGSSETTTTTIASQKLRVVTTTAILSDFARIVGGDRIEVYDVIKPGADPHDYEPTPADITALARADIIVRNGLGLEDWFEETIDGAESQAAVVDASTGVTLRRTEGSTEPDPHIWHSPVNARLMVGNIRRALEAADPAGASVYQSSERAYSAQLDALRGDIRRLMDGLPNKNLVTNHDSLGYFVEEFGLNYVGSIIPSFDSQAELSGAQITELVAEIRAQGVKAVFAESTLPRAAAETIAAEAGVKVVAGDDAIYGDSLGPAGGPADTYLKMERHNADVIYNNLR